MPLLPCASPLRRARRAARGGRWAKAAEAYRRHLAGVPGDVAARVQLGHSLKEAGETEAAAFAYRQALSDRPGDEDLSVHLAHLEWRLGRREKAIGVLLAAIDVAGVGAARAVQALIDMGARERLPLPIQELIEAEAGDYTLARYAAWRAARAVSRAGVPPDVLAVIDARNAGSALIEVTRTGLAGVACRILGIDMYPDEPIGTAEVGESHVLLVEAGTRLAPDVIAQLHAALAATGAGAAYGDHDHWELCENGEIAFADPCLQPMADPIWFARSEVRPPCLLMTGAAAADAGWWGRLADAHMALPVRYAHVPLMLASRRVRGVPADNVPPVFFPLDLIQIVIQTRDAPGLLRACVESLRATAVHPDALDIVIVDNRSVLAETAALLAGWMAEGIARTIHYDAPFNWARANNLAAEGRAPLLLFLNNDVEIDTPGWDNALRAGLAEKEAGVLGALLLYPDRLIQHAGVIFGMGVAGSPVHEGVGHPLKSGGPAARWHHPRLAAAVTGAWLAITRTLFDAVGGFEERLPIAYNDIDFCLRCRAVGGNVVQASHIVALHHESATRGVTMSEAEVARDRADWAWLRTRWGGALDLDPAYNPNWARTGLPFDGLRHPTPQAVARWIAASGRLRPWALTADPVS